MKFTDKPKPESKLPMTRMKYKAVYDKMEALEEGEYFAVEFDSEEDAKKAVAAIRAHKYRSFPMQPFSIYQKDKDVWVELRREGD